MTLPNLGAGGGHRVGGTSLAHASPDQSVTNKTTTRNAPIRRRKTSQAKLNSDSNANNNSEASPTFVGQSQKQHNYATSPQNHRRKESLAQVSLHNVKRLSRKLSTKSKTKAASVRARSSLSFDDKSTTGRLLASAKQHNQRVAMCGDELLAAAVDDSKAIALGRQVVDAYMARQQQAKLQLQQSANVVGSMNAISSATPTPEQATAVVTGGKSMTANSSSDGSKQYESGERSEDFSLRFMLTSLKSSSSNSFARAPDHKQAQQIKQRPSSSVNSSMSKRKSFRDLRRMIGRLSRLSGEDSTTSPPSLLPSADDGSNLILTATVASQSPRGERKARKALQKASKSSVGIEASKIIAHSRPDLTSTITKSSKSSLGKVFRRSETVIEGVRSDLQ